MDNTELDTLLEQYRLEFYWAEDRREWRLSGKNRATEPEKAVNLLAAQRAAVRYIENYLIRPKGNYLNYEELDTLLAKHRMSFHWSDVGNKWFVIWQIEGGNELMKSKPQHAVDRWEAQLAAAEFIKAKFPPAP